MTVAILGGGHGGHCMAADLTLRGFKVNFFEHPNFENNFKKVLQNKSIELCGPIKKGLPKINLVTTNIKEAIEKVDIIHLVVPASAHDIFFSHLMPDLSDGQTIILWAADLGSLRLNKILKDNGIKKKLNIYETHTLAYGTRLREPGVVELSMVARQINIAALPASKTDKTLNTLKEMFPVLNPVQNVIAVAFSNPNPVVHPVGIIFNVGRIEYLKGDWNMHTQGFTQKVLEYSKSVYGEIVQVAAQMGIKIFHYKESDFDSFSNISGAHFFAPEGMEQALSKMRGPSIVNGRHLMEDLPYGLLPVSELGKKVGVKTPAIDGMINVASILCAQNFWDTGRTLKSLGLDQMTKAQILHFVQN